MTEQKQLSYDEIEEKIMKECPYANYIKNFVIAQWAQQILDGKYNDYKVPPEGLQYEENDEDVIIEIDDNQYDEEDDECEYGDIIMIKDQPFVVPSGMVIPKSFLDKILPEMDKEMKKMGISQDDIEQALEEQYN